MKQHTAIYHGWRDGNGTAHVTADDKPLNARFDLDNHSPNGFEWGYAGSGPAQLALAMVADATGNDGLALRVHQHFKRKLIQHLDQESDWVISAEQVREIAKQLAEELKIT